MMEGKFRFDDSFIFGTSTAAYQIEGAVHADGRGPSIWDTFSHQPGKIDNGENGDVACEHYSRWTEDVDLMARIGTNGYRFSISWPRIFPAGKGRINQKGLDFYSRLCDALLERGIEPSATLYHWDLPQALQDEGGWTERDTALRFVEFAEAMYMKLGDRVRRWYTHNEPWVAAWFGHYQGKHAPGKTSAREAVIVAHHLLLSHGEAVKAFRQASIGKGEIGIVLNLIPIAPATVSDDDAKAARLADGLHNRWFLDPLFFGRYPEDILDHFSRLGIRPEIRDEDLIAISQPMDFLGFNFYTRKTVEAGGSDPVFRFAEKKPTDVQYTGMNWQVHPESLYGLMMRLKTEYGNPRLFITENGAAYPDPKPQSGIIEDLPRAEYLREHFRQAARAIREGARLEGYYIWTLMDNFEWSFGCSKRFGIVGVDFKTQERIIKRSALWYSDLIKKREIDL